MLHLSDITNIQKFLIAEFIYSYDAEILLKTDTVKVIEVLDQLGVERPKTSKIEPTPIYKLIKATISEVDIAQVVKMYVSGEFAK